MNSLPEQQQQQQLEEGKEKEHSQPPPPQQQQQQQQEQQEQQQEQQQQQLTVSVIPETSDIKRLDDATVRRITAEQAISDLASIVKELIDNSLDAESTTIKIRLFGQGLDIIEVSDDGNGVPIDSRPYMATRHATSKIECIQDIYTGTGLTMGFRGEALFAMSCVSESIVVASRTEDDDLATKLIFDNKDKDKNSNSSSSSSELPPNDQEGDNNNNNNKSVQQPEPQQQPQKYTLLARKVGTTVAVVKPFGNLPARRADITRRIRQERTKIFKLVESYGIFNVGVCFRLMDINQNREEIALATSSTSISIQETSSTLLGSAFVRGISSFELSLESYFRNINNSNNTNINNNTNQKQQQQQQQQKKETDDEEKNDDVCYNWGIRGLISIEPSLIAAAAAAQKNQRQKRGRITSTAGGGSGGSDRVRSVQYYSINGRVVDLPKVTTLLRKLWTTFSNSTTANNTKQKKPSAILEFTLPNHSFDINLSPDKRTVLLTNESDLLGIIEEHVTKLWSNESSGIFVDGGTTSLSSTQRQQNNPNKQHNNQQQQQQQQSPSSQQQQQQQQKQQKQQQQRITAARVSVGGKSTGANTSCRRCARGPSYKHGHDITCPLSQMFNGNGVTDIEVEEDDYPDSDDDDDDDDDGEVDDNGNRQKHKRRFAFVHDLSKAKMQHDLAGRQKERQQETNELNNNNDDDQIEGRRPLKQTKLSTVVLKLSTMTVAAKTTTGANIGLSLNNGDESTDENRPRKKAKTLPKEEEIEGPITSSSTDTQQFEEKEASTTVFSNNNKSDVLENENDIALTINDNDATQSQQQHQQLPPMDKISDLERRKWNEIQAKFYSGDDDDGGLQLEQESLQTMISRSISIGVGSSSENTRTKEPVTPDDFTLKSPSVTTTTDLQAGSQQTLSSSSPSYRKETRPEEDNNNEGNGKQTIEKSNEQSSRVVSSSSFAASSSVTLPSSYSSSARRRPLLGNLQQFAFQPDNNKKDSDGDVAMGSRGINSLTSKELPPIPTSNQTRPKYNKNDEDSSKISSSTTNTSQQSNTRVRQKIRESRRIADNGKDDIESLPLKGKTKSTSNSNQKQKLDTEIANASDDCSTADDEVVVWESFSSTQDVCYNARLERLNMRKRKHDIDEIRRNLIIKSKDGNTSIVEDSPSRTEESPYRTMNEIDKEVGFDDEHDDDDDRNSSNPFIRISKSTFRDGMQVIGQFNLGFVLAKCSRNHLWILDQHACEERYNFEELCKKTVMHEQPLIQPLHLELNPSEEACVLDHMDIFQANGFRFKFDAEAPIRHRLSLTALPHSGAHEGRKAVQFGPSDVSALCAILTEGSSYDAGSGGTGTDGLGMYGNNAVRNHTNATSTQGDNADRILARLPKAIAMFASRACRTSVMIGTALSQKEMSNVVQKLAYVDMPWTCAHGRPTMRHVSNVLPILLMDERSAAEHIAIPTVTCTPLTQQQPDE